MFRDKKNLEILQKALAIIAEEEAAKLPSEEECVGVTFSEEFERKMEKLIKFQKKPYYSYVNTVGKRVACIILAVLIALTTVTFSVKALREAVIEFFVETFEKFSIVRFSEDDTSENSRIIEDYYVPTYIPEGYKLQNDEKLISKRRITYNKGNAYLYFIQSKLQSNSTYFDTENSIVQEVSVLNHKAIYVKKSDGYLICWNDINYFYLIQTDEKLNAEELVRIAESVELE